MIMVDAGEEEGGDSGGEAKEGAEPESSHHVRLFSDKGAAPVVQDAPKAGHGEGEAQGEGNLPAVEPGGDEGRLPHDQALSSQAEDEAAQEHEAHGVDGDAQGGDELAEEDEEGEDHNAGTHPHRVDQVASQEGQEDIGDRVYGIEEVEIQLECGSLGGETVVVEQEVLLDLGVEGRGRVCRKGWGSLTIAEHWQRSHVEDSEDIPSLTKRKQSKITSKMDSFDNA